MLKIHLDRHSFEPLEDISLYSLKRKSYHPHASLILNLPLVKLRNSSRKTEHIRVEIEQLYPKVNFRPVYFQIPPCDGWGFPAKAAITAILGVVAIFSPLDRLSISRRQIRKIHGNLMWIEYFQANPRCELYGIHIIQPIIISDVSVLVAISNVF